MSSSKKTLETSSVRSNDEVQELRKLVEDYSIRNDELQKKMEDIERNQVEELQQMRKSFIARVSAGTGTRRSEKESLDSAEHLLPRDTYSFFACVRYFSSDNKCPLPGISFFLALSVMAIQVCTMSLLAVDVIDIKHDQNPPNFLGVPTGVGWQVRVTQVLAILITVVSQDEVRLSLNVLATGYDEVVLNAMHEGVSKPKWYFSLISRFLVGCLGLSVTFMLIVRADTVRDMLLDFTAVEFISQLDNGLFALAKWGFIGATSQQEARKISSAISFEDNDDNRRRIRKGRILRAFFLLGVFAILFGKCVNHVYVVCGSVALLTFGTYLHSGFWLFITLKQMSGAYLSQTIYVQFGDEFDPAFSTFSGLYEINGSKELDNNRVGYYLKYPGPFAEAAKFGYTFCAGEGVWAFSYDDDFSVAPNICNLKARSPVSDSFDLSSTADLPWAWVDPKSKREPPLQRFSMTTMQGYSGKRCLIDSDCGDRFTCESNACVCKDEWYGLNCEFLAPCEMLEGDTRLDGFVDSRPRSNSYKLLRDPITNRMIEAYYRPVFVSDKTDEGSYDLIFFTGRRWALTNTNRFTTETGLEDESEIAAYMESGFHAYWSDYTILFMSDPVDVDTPTDSATPIGLRWYHADSRAEFTQGKQLARTNQLSGAILLCAICDDHHNPCFYGNSCSNGTCVCTTGSSGTLCQSPPSGNGRCDSFFNNAEFQYDGGDCCQSTCVSTDESSCGVREGSGFLLPREYIGYSYCVDPTQQCPQDDNSCWNPLYQISGPSIVAISRNGAFMAVASRGGVPQVFEQDGSQLILRNLPLDDITSTGPFPSIAVSGDGSVVAASLPVDTDILAKAKGQVKVFRWDARRDAYKQIGEDILVDAVTFGVAHGGAVELSDDGLILAIGAPDSFTSSSIDFVLVYKYGINGWTQLAELRGRDGDGEDNFGSSLSMSSNGKVIAAGAPRARDSAGYARVYKCNESTATYMLTGHFEGDTAGEAFFGNAVSLSSSGEVLAIGAHRSSAGYVETFEYSSESQEWSRNGKLVGDIDEYFGETLALSDDGKFLVAGSTFTDTLVGANAGAVRSYKYNETGGWEQYLEVIEGGEPFVNFGLSLSLSGDGHTLAVGNDRNSQRTGAVGSVTIYRSATLPSTEIDNTTHDTVAITVAIQLDAFPEQSGFSLECGGVFYASVPTGSLNSPNELRYETFFVANQTKCQFMILDSFEDGICCAYGQGYYEIYYGEDMSDQENLLAQGGQLFGGREKITFIASPPTNLVPVTISLGKGRYGSEDTDFFFDCSDVLETELQTESAFRSRGPVTRDTFLVPNGTACNFIKTDHNEAGGSYNISIGDSIVAASDSIGFGNAVLFIAAPPGLHPPATILTLCCFSVRIDLDEFPLETGWSLSCDNEVLYEALPGTYLEMDDWINENFCVFNMSSCEFHVRDDYGDGFNGTYKVGAFLNGEDFDPFSFNITHDFDVFCPIGGEDEPTRTSGD